MPRVTGGVGGPARPSQRGTGPARRIASGDRGSRAPKPGQLQCAILVGLQGAGKSTFYRRHLAATHRRVSKDLLRNVRARQARQTALVEAALREGASVAIDNTNPAPADRRPLVTLAHAHRAEAVAYFFDAPLVDCLRRNRTRAGRERVPEVAIYATAARLIPPSLQEGFDRLFRVATRDGEFAIAEVRDPGGSPSAEPSSSSR